MKSVQLRFSHALDDMTRNAMDMRKERIKGKFYYKCFVDAVDYVLAGAIIQFEVYSGVAEDEAPKRSLRSGPLSMISVKGK